MPKDLASQLAALKGRFPTILFAETEHIYGDELSITPEGGLEPFSALVEATTPRVIFHYFFKLTPDSFKIQPFEPADEDGLPVRPEVDVSKAPLLKPYLKYLEQPQSLTVYFLYEGHKVTTTVFADWSESFQQACEQAYEGEVLRKQEAEAQARAEHQKTRHAREATLVQRFDELLPQDAEFCRLACEPRPRVTDLYERGKEIMGDLDDWDKATLYRAVRRIAAEIKTAAREARKRKSHD